MTSSEQTSTPRVWCVRADGCKYTEHFIKGGFAGIGWSELSQDLSSVSSRDELTTLVKGANPGIHSPVVIGNWVGQIARFLLEIKAGDYIITPAVDSEWLHYGVVEPYPSYFYFTGDDGCRFHHRRRVKWSDKLIKRSDFSVPFQNTIRSLLSVFLVSQQDEFCQVIGRKDLASEKKPIQYDSYKVVLEQILELDATEFEILVGHLLTALGFEGSEVVGKAGDGGVDAVGELNVSNLMSNNTCKLVIVIFHRVQKSLVDIYPAAWQRECVNIIYVQHFELIFNSFSWICMGKEFLSDFVHSFISRSILAHWILFLYFSRSLSTYCYFILC